MTTTTDTKGEAKGKITHRSRDFSSGILMLLLRLTWRIMRL